MKGKTKGNKKLFVCTMPYQYLIARLIKEGCNFQKCDIVILNHFEEAFDLYDKVKQTGVWENVFFLDDTILDEYKQQLNIFGKFFFYRSWEKYLPKILKDISDYSEVFLVHDNVALEYAILRKFKSEGKSATIIDEGYGSYINNNTKDNWRSKLLKYFSPWLGLPGSYIGSLKWIDSIWVQYPELIAADTKNPNRNKAKKLPIYLKDFLQIPEITDELYMIYPELNEIDLWVQGLDTMSVVLTESWLDRISNRNKYISEIISKVNESLGNDVSPIFFKQHPGENSPIHTVSNTIKVLPRKLPIELLFLILLKNDIKKINLFSFGSTALMNLYDFYKEEEGLDIYVIESMETTEDFKVLFPRFCEFAVKYQVRFNTV